VTERTQLILFFVVSTFFIVVFIAILLVYRHGRTTETKTILKAIEGTRQQLSVHSDSVLGEMRILREGVAWIREKWVKFSK
jgi:hypothetical protein